MNKQATSNSQPDNGQNKTSRDKELAHMLVKGEEVILCAKVHGAIYWRACAILVIAVLLLLVATPLAIIAGIAGGFLLCVAILTQHYLLLVVTNKRVLARYGLLQMDVVDIRLSKIESIDLERMLLGHMLGYASVVVAGTGQRIIRVPYVSNAEVFRRYYNEMVLVEEGNEEAEEEISKMKEQADDIDAQNKNPNKI